MKRTNKIFKIIIIVMLTMIATYLHYRAIQGNLALHILHREFFFVPIILAAFWFGLKGGLIASVSVSIIYAPHVIMYKDPHGEFSTVILQLLTFNLIGFILGWLVKRKDIYNKDKQFLTETFGRYVPQKIREHVLKGKHHLNGAICDVTVLISKVHNFDVSTKDSPPWEVVNVINIYFTEMADIVRQYDGLIVGFSEDEFRVVFGAPVSQPDHKRRGLETALDMRERLKKVNDEISTKGFPSLEQSIGLHAGLALGANIGSPSRQSYNLVGKTVKIAKAIQNRCEQEEADILVSTETLEKLRGVFHSKQVIPNLQVLGDSVEIHAIINKDDK